MLEWSGIATHAVIGYNLREGLDDDFPQFDNFPFSGSPRVNLVACLNQERGVVWSNLLFKVGDVSGDPSAKCLAKYEEDIDIFGSLPLSLAPNVESCPCSAFQAILDRRFIVNFVAQPPSPSSYCFIQRFPFRRGPRQECCYSTLIDSWVNLHELWCIFDRHTYCVDLALCWLRLKAVLLRDPCCFFTHSFRTQNMLIMTWDSGKCVATIPIDATCTMRDGHRTTVLYILLLVSVRLGNVIIRIMLMVSMSLCSLGMGRSSYYHTWWLPLYIQWLGRVYPN